MENPGNDTLELLNAIPMPMMVIGADFTISGTNSACDTILGPNLAGRHFVTALRQPALIAQIENAARSKDRAQGHYRSHEGQGDSNYLVHIAPIRNLIVLTFEDRTAAETIGQLRREFVANVSHELRSPLTALSGFIETLRGPAKDDEAARDRFLEIMARETDRMTQLVGDLLSLSRVEENERVRPSDAVSLSEIVAMTLAEIDPVIKAANAHVVLQDDSGGATVPGDQMQLRQVIGNLVENAVKYGQMSEDVTIQISAVGFLSDLRRDGISLSINNKGPVIARHHLPRLTERFYRIDAHRSRVEGGTGLGLAIVKHIVKRHRGKLTIQSESAVGTTVRVSLPTKDPVLAASDS